MSKHEDIKTWDDYKDYVIDNDPDMADDMKTAVRDAEVIAAIISQRDALGLSQRDLARLCKVPQSTIARIESRAITPRFDTLLKIFDKLDLEIIISPKKRI